MPNLFMFIPWEKENTSDFWENYSLGKMKKNWKKAQANRPEDKARTVQLIYYTGKARKRLKNISDNDVVYIVGHCTTASDVICASESGAHPLDYEDLSKRVEKSGLRKDFAGKVKLFGCKGGVGSGDAIGWSFTEGFAMILAGVHDYKACTVVGYKGVLHSSYFAANGEQQQHKVILDEDDHVVGRAKHHRVFYKDGALVHQ